MPDSIMLVSVYALAVIVVIAAVVFGICDSKNTKKIKYEFPVVHFYSGKIKTRNGFINDKQRGNKNKK